MTRYAIDETRGEPIATWATAATARSPCWWRRWSRASISDSGWR
jgi:hypothetical protein